MEEERVFSGFCRQQDQTRRVFFSYELTESGPKLSDCDCSFFTCPFTDTCTIAGDAHAVLTEK